MTIEGIGTWGNGRFAPEVDLPSRSPLPVAEVRSPVFL
jgi:hypothetical protein